MTLRAIALLILVTIAGSLNAQTQPKTKARPNIPGNFIVDIGLNGTMKSPLLWKQALWGSRTANVYYQYPLRFGRTRFSFNPGIGLSMERFSWKNDIVLRDPAEPNLNAQVEKYEFYRASSTFPGVKRVKLINNYVEIPLEIRFDTKPEDISRSFNVALGVRGGWMYDSFIKVKYKDDGQVKKMKDKQDWGLTQIRYGAYGRIGIGGFNIFGFYNLTPLFQKDKGPNDAGTIASSGTGIGGPTGTLMNTFTIGLSINGF